MPNNAYVIRGPKYVQDSGGPDEKHILECYANPDEARRRATVGNPLAVLGLGFAGLVGFAYLCISMAQTPTVEHAIRTIQTYLP